LSAKAKSLPELIQILEFESSKAIRWFQNNKMIVNASKFQAIILTKKKEHITNNLIINNEVIESKLMVELLGISIDDKLNFNTQISNICRQAANQLNSLYRFNNYLDSYSRKLATISYILSNFSYCPLVWHFCSAKSKDKLEKLNNRAFKFLNQPNESLQTTLEIKRLRLIILEIFKTLNGLNPPFMNDIFSKSVNRSSDRFCNNLKSFKVEHVTFGKRSLRFIGPVLWNSLPQNIKDSKDINKFKQFLKEWGNPGCPHYNKFVNYCTALSI